MSPTLLSISSCLTEMTRNLGSGSYPGRTDIQVAQPGQPQQLVNTVLVLGTATASL